MAALLPKQAALLAKAVPVLVPVFGALYVVSRFFKQVKPVSEGLLDYVRQPNYREHMGYQHQVLADIRYLNGRLQRRRRAPRVVVFIDDLDRCSDEKVLETLQAINLLLTASGCYVFLGIDTDMIIRAIQRHYDFATDPQDKARSYLRKILQINVRLQPPAPVIKAEFLDAFFSAESQLQLAYATGEAVLILPDLERRVHAGVESEPGRHAAGVRHAARCRRGHHARAVGVPPARRARADESRAS